MPLKLPSFGTGNPNAGNNGLGTNQAGSGIPMLPEQNWGGAAGTAVGMPAVPNTGVPMMQNIYDRNRIRNITGK